MPIWPKVMQMLNFRDNYPLSQVTTLQIGGPAKKFVVVKTLNEFIEAIQFAKENNLQFLVIGGGSNLLISDEGADLLIIKNEASGIEQDGEILKVKSGTITQDLVDYSAKNGLSGLQKLSGLPGTIGGAIFGNAGAYGQTISDHLISISVFDGEKKVRLDKDQCKFNYRYSIFKENGFTILEAEFKLEKADPEILQKEAKDIFDQRQIKYPVGMKCPGSFFKNLIASELPAEVLKNIPPEKIVHGKIPAGALLEEVGAKGQSLDGIEISSKHANLFINKGNGTAKSFIELAKQMRDKVKERFGITLESEVKLINLFDFRISVNVLSCTS